MLFLISLACHVLISGFPYLWHVLYMFRIILCIHDFNEHHLAWTAPSVWSIVWGSLNTWTICKLVVYYIYTSCFVPVTWPVPVYLLWYGILFCYVLFCLLFSSCMIEEWWAQCGLSIQDIISIPASFTYLKCILVLYLVSNLVNRFNKFSFTFTVLCSCLNWFLAKLSCLILVVLVLRCSRRCLWGGLSGGGCWATHSSLVATKRRHLDVGQDPEMRDFWLGLFILILLGMYWPLLAFYWVVT